MKTGDILNGKYRIEKLLGKGGTGTVYLCTNIELGNRWAVKHIPAEILNDKTAAEVDILKKLYHTSLPRIVDVFKNTQGLFIVESNMEGVPLSSLIKRQGAFELCRIVELSLELCNILKYLHGVRPNPIIYRDMKPSNIILTQNNRLALVDFGISKELPRYRTKDTFIAGTSAYSAPEQLIRGGVTDQRTDIYNLGATMYQLLYGRLPRGSSDDFAPTKDKAADRMNKLMAKCMENKPESRFQRVEDVIEELAAVKEMLMLGKLRRKIVLKLEIALIIVLSITSYIVMILGILVCR